MKRRSLLGAASTSIMSLAGCLGESEYTITDVQVGTSLAPVGLDVDVLESDAEIEHPARLDSRSRTRRMSQYGFGTQESDRSEC